MDVHVPVSIREAPSLAAVKGPTRLLVSVLYMKSTEPFLIGLISSAASPAQVNSLRVRHWANAVLPQKTTYPEFMRELLVFQVNKNSASLLKGFVRTARHPCLFFDGVE